MTDRSRKTDTNRNKDGKNALYGGNKTETKRTGSSAGFWWKNSCVLVPDTCNCLKFLPFLSAEPMKCPLQFTEISLANPGRGIVLYV
jgi:hypothetical protein